MPHDFVKWPELTNSQMDIYYLESPHKQILSDFRGVVVKVHDGDTVTVRTKFRDFDFPIRFLDTNAPELNEPRGHEVQEWLEGILLGEEVDILINPKQRVGKWGRLLGTIFHRGLNINEESIQMGMAKPFDQKDEGKIPEVSKWLAF